MSVREGDMGESLCEGDMGSSLHERGVPWGIMGRGAIFLYGAFQEVYIYIRKFEKEHNNI